MFSRGSFPVDSSVCERERRATGMCGRARCTLNPDRVARACDLGDGGDDSIQTYQIDRYRPSYNVSPGAYMPVVRKEKAAGGEKAVIHCMKWGLVPSFTKKAEKPDHYKMFNARSESIKEKASFRRLIPTNRCIVAVEGFYEWKKDGSKKQPYYIHFKDHRPLVLAALYDSWKNSEGEVLHTFTILTTRSSTALEWLHDRMPVVLGKKDSISIWLNNSLDFETILGPYEGSDLIQLKYTGDKPISQFFTKKANATDQPEQKNLKLSKEFTQRNASDSVKEEPSGEESGEPIKEENIANSDILLPKEPIQGETCGIKRELEETTPDSGIKVENISMLPYSQVKKKERATKDAGDGQASLLSYFGRK
ncbi:uncharacterized protein [Typha angustifolia]|uniref:uncharacterized protein isoform X2 n=1 Tax=Typha angustifolia TaxID=59011 RepID=UPI003C2AF129